MADEKSSSGQKVMPIMGHVRELQVRLTVSAIIFIAAACLAYVFRDQIIHLLLSPLNGQKLTYLNPSGGFSFIMLVSIYTGLAVAAPIVIQQIYGFIKPILSTRFQKKSGVIFFSSLLLLIAGVAFGYIFAIPGALNFLYSFAGDYVEASLTADSYLNFIVAYTLGIGLVFQLPLILMLIHWIKPITPTGLLKSERWIVVLSFVAAALITPTPDPLNQTIIALPIVLVYQIGVGAVLWSIYRDNRRIKRANRPTEELSNKEIKTATAPKALESPQSQAQAAPQPLTQSKTAAHTQPIPRPTAQKVVNSSKPAPKTVETKLVSDMIIKHRPIPQRVDPIQPKNVQKIDGFIRTAPAANRPQNRAISVPERHNLDEQIDQSRTSLTQEGRRPRLSLDGINVASEPAQ